MSLQKQLADLRRQKRDQLKAVHLTYIRTKRDLRRAVSPDRIIRKHLAASLSIAAISGLLLAPRPRGAEPAGSGRGRRAGFHVPSWMKALLGKFMPQASAFIPGAGEGAAAVGEGAGGKAGSEEAAAEKRGSPRSLVRSAVMEIGMLLLSKIDFQKLIPVLIHAVSSRMKSKYAEGAESPGGDGAAEGVADEPRSADPVSPT